MRAMLVCFSLIIVTLTAPFAAAQKVDLTASRVLSRDGVHVAAKSAAGETLTAPNVDGVNSFEAPNPVVHEAHLSESARRQLTLKLEPGSVTVISVEQ
jgi:alpha-N-arabinofuranosidase